MTIDEVRAAFGGNRYRTANELAVALGRQPGKGWQRKLANALSVMCSIEARRVYIGGKRCRVYDIVDFAQDDKGKVRGTLSAWKTMELQADRSILVKASKKADELERDKSIPWRQKFFQLQAYIQYYLARPD